MPQVGAEELAPEEYRAASELRSRLTSAVRVKQQLDAALRGLGATPAPASASGGTAASAAAPAAVGPGPRGRQVEQLTEAVEAAIREAAR